jgi:hypothetical protein
MSVLSWNLGLVGYFKEALSITERWVELWDQRGPPDMCEKLDGQWVCK